MALTDGDSKISNGKYSAVISPCEEGRELEFEVWPLETGKSVFTQPTGMEVSVEYWNTVMSYLTNEKLKELLINNNPDRYAIFTEQRQSRNAGTPDNKLKRKRAAQHLGGTQEEGAPYRPWRRSWSPAQEAVEAHTQQRSTSSHSNADAMLCGRDVGASV